MKFLLIFSLFAAGIALAASMVSKDQCLFNNLKKLFNTRNQQFVYKFLEMTCDGKEPVLCAKAKEMDALGDEVLASWEKCKECPFPPACRAPFLAECALGSHKMQTLINRFVPLVMKLGPAKVFKTIKHIADNVLALNQKALKC